jgi:5-oxopent-3-ene-1,2,5-tricarboxylate decarboxylase/2-hydroxyhepta-2,4-diene-1,7-dioate isomerase
MHQVINKTTKILCLAENYKKDCKEPLIFIKTTNTLTNLKKINIDLSSKVWGEVELALIIKKEANNVLYSEAFDYIKGFSIANDVTIENILGRDHHLALSKCQDDFCPIYSNYSEEFDWNNKYIKCFHNDILLREGNLSDLLWDPYKAIEELSKNFTLHENDLILLGTPPRVRDRIYLKNGDKFICEIEGLGKMENFFYAK